MPFKPLHQAQALHDDGHGSGGQQQRAGARLLVLGMAVLVTLLVVACGNGSSPTSSAVTPTVSSSQLTSSPPPTTTSQATQSASSTATTVQVQIIEQNERYQFSPQTLTIKKGTRVVWLNKSDAPHTVTSNNGAFSDSDTIGEGATFTLLFTTAGTYQYHCSIHTYMTATIIVTA
ncbi:MAG: cupredoxin domain-containing protein [Thermogemmatispora sp.]|uniref:plastocyanin/azurin family copper-binding protein n=1 Tax=Thermogemmatispora sp. TaxID=1968838 RepID=UPI00260C6BB4|nr:cupredoxin domain-containing protein [Thermogemmatispora sp.]MBX5458319.1 cupredoxin domain-containing protein [Thermogemmatispora sp.]